MHASAQLNFRFRPDDGSVNSGAVQPKNEISFFRQSWVELGGHWGAVRAGRQLSPLQELNGNYDAWGTDTVATPHTGGINSGTRYNNFVEYRSPVYAGLQVFGGIASREDNVNGAPLGTLATSAPTGIAAQYSAGPLAAALAWDRNGVGQKTVGAYASYDFKVATLLTQYEKGDIGTSGAIINGIGVARPSRPGVTSVTRYSLTSLIPLGATVLKVGLGHYPDEQMNKLSLGADYFLSKRTNLYVDFGKLRGANSNLTSLNKQPRFDIGIWHRF